MAPYLSTFVDKLSTLVQIRINSDFSFRKTFVKKRILIMQGPPGGGGPPKGMMGLRSHSMIIEDALNITGAQNKKRNKYWSIRFIFSCFRALIRQIKPLYKKYLKYTTRLYWIIDTWLTWLRHRLYETECRYTHDQGQHTHHDKLSGLGKLGGLESQDGGSGTTNNQGGNPKAGWQHAGEYVDPLQPLLDFRRDAEHFDHHARAARRSVGHNAAPPNNSHLSNINGERRSIDGNDGGTGSGSELDAGITQKKKTEESESESLQEKKHTPVQHGG